MANLKDTFVLGKLTVTDSIIADKFKGPLEGNAATATKFNTSRTFSFGGDVSGTVTTDCASGFEVSLIVADSSHNHTYTNITDLDTPLTNYLNTAKGYTDEKIAALIDSSPDLLNTLNELAAAINDDPNFATTVADNIATKLSKTGGTMSGAITFNASTVDAIKYAGSKNTYTMIKFINNTTDVNGNGIMIGGGGSVYIGSGESAANLYSALGSPSGGDEAIHISGDDAIKFYSNCQTIANRKETTYDKSGNWTMPGQITATQFNGAATRIALGGVADSTKYGAYAGIIQSSTGGPESGAWHNSIKILHNNPDGYYTQLAHNFTGSHGLWHRSCRGGTISDWIKILDSNNYQGVLDNTYLQLTGGTMSGALHAHGGITLNDSTAQASGAPPYILGIKAFAEGGNVTWSSKENVSVGHADAATKLVNARTFTIGNTARSFDGSANVSWTPNDIGYRYEWNASVRGVTWSRLCNMGAAVNVEGSKYILNISATRGNVVYNDTFLITAHHASNGKIIKIAGNNYTSGHQIRLLVNSNGDSYVELYDNAQSITTATYQTVRCRIIPIFTGTPTLYTSFTNGTTLPTGYSVKQTMTINTTDMQGNLSGNADTATAVLDYGNTAKTIQIGFEGAGLSTTSYFAAYDHSNANVRKIKDISVATTKTVLGLIQKGGTAQPVYFDSNGSPAACSATVGGTAKPVYMSSGTITECSATLGSISKPVFMSAGTITECSANIGGAAKPVYMSGGAITECSSTVGGSTSQPVYMNAGTITGMTRVGVAYGGTGKSSWSTNRLIYASASTTLSTSTHYINSTKIAINSTSAPTDNFYVNGTSYFNGNITTVNTAVISNASVGGSYVKARDFAFIKHTNSDTGSKYAPLISGKTQVGEISCGIIHPYEQMEWIYTTDTGYNANNNTGLSADDSTGGYRRILAVNKNGAVTASSYHATSDKRLKTNLRSFVPQKSILDLPMYKFDFINGTKNQIGCMAQDLQEICPEIVSEDNEGYLSINESKIVYLLIDEVKKLRLKVSLLEGEYNGKL